ncbi:sensor histidine kinase [Polaromonas naphthalenivorans]|uniref:histidine kinase n=1 Tax=Polaromonas naphthalenivorans (strain CJ2) TaxID=365044 RepID=A1VUP8_POLNA|nr:sensor histidine kinase [Polaromonas naphthalenivorans]ABM39376.1 integral membrane sensor signal transduction histidine kinase [Polaromonas naphthalenivorans CJ2]
MHDVWVSRKPRHGWLAYGMAVALAALMACWPGRSSAEPLHFQTAQVLGMDEGHGFSAPPYLLEAANPQGDWRPVSLPHAVPPELLPGVDDPLRPRTVVSWYRLQVPRQQDAADALNPYYLYIPRWKTDGQLAVYASGRLVYRSSGNLLWNGSNHPLWIPLDKARSAELPDSLLLRVEHLRATGAAVSSVWLGRQDEIGWRYRMRDLLQVQLPLMVSAAFLAVGLFALFVWIRQKAASRAPDSLYLLFFAMSLASFIRSLHFYVGQFKLPLPDQWFGWLTISALFWLIATSHFLLVRLHRRPQPRLSRAVIGITALVSLVTLPLLSAVLPGASELARVIYLVLLGMGFAIAISGLRNARLAGSGEGLLLASWGVAGMLLGVHDWLLQNNLVSVEGSYLSVYVGTGLFLIFMYIMFRRYLGALEEARQANASLAQRLRAREAELNASHARLREVEHRQTLSQERQRLMQDMHDGLGSSLVSALRVVEDGQLHEAQVADVLRSCIDDLKLAIDSMEPVEADLLLLLATLRFRLGNRLKSSSIRLVWNISDVPALPWLDPRNALHILRILQEAFANILKHAQASEIGVSTSAGNGWIEVAVADNGQGFSVDEAMKGGGKGLMNQRRRAEAIGGEVLLASSSKGSVLTLRLPEKHPA